MKIKCCLLFLLVLLCVPNGVLALEKSPEPWSGELVRVIDGDSLVILRNGVKTKVRLYGIDCPDGQRPFSAEGEEFMRGFLGQKLEVKSLYVGKHGRCIAKVYSPDHKELNLELIKKGLAWWYQRYAPHDWDYMEAMLKAHKEAKGLWSLDKPTPPWVRRMGRRK